MPKVDIAVTTLADALAAAQGGADSMEISVDLAADGLTPPLELVRQIRVAVMLDIHVIIRPHNRDFCYTPEEKVLMLAQMDAFAPLNIQGVVIGGHDVAGLFDVALIETVQQRYPQWVITVHRALDSCQNPDEALQQMRGKAHRVLASGKAATAQMGKTALRAWTTAFRKDYRFVAAGKITLAEAAALAHETGVHEIHTASAVRTEGTVDPAKVQQLVQSLKF